MKKNTLFYNGAMLLMVGGLVLFGAGYFLPDDIALQVSAFLGGAIGFVIYLLVNRWDLKDGARRSIVMFVVTALMSAWASLCLLISCSVFAKLPLCTENRRNAFVILDFFFPMLIVFFSWLSGRWTQSRQ